MRCIPAHWPDAATQAFWKSVSESFQKTEGMAPGHLVAEAGEELPERNGLLHPTAGGGYPNVNSVFGALVGTSERLDDSHTNGRAAAHLQGQELHEIKP